MFQSGRGFDSQRYALARHQTRSSVFIASLLILIKVVALFELFSLVPLSQQVILVVEGEGSGGTQEVKAVARYGIVI